MKLSKFIFKSLLPFGTIILFFAPLFYVNGIMNNQIDILRSNINPLLTILTSLIFVGLIALSVLTFFNKLFNIKFFVSIILFIYSCVFIALWGYLNKDIEVSVCSGFFLLLISLGVLNLYYCSIFFENNGLMIRDIVEIALFVSLAIALDLPFCKIHIGQNGGSISLTMLPLILLSLRKGTIKGFIAAGIIYGFLTCLLDGYGFMAFPFDYLLGYGSMCLIGLFRKFILKSKTIYPKIIFFIVGVALCGIARTLFSTISGVIFYELTPVASFVYNIAYIGPSMAGCAVVGIVILPIFLQIMKKYPR